MRLVLFGVSSLAYWLTAAAPPDRENAVSGKCIARCAPSSLILDHVSARFPQIPEPYHCLAPGACRSCGARAAVHISRRPYAKGSFYRIADGLYVSSPELCFVQVAQGASLHELVKVGSALCGTFRLAPTQGGGLSSRERLTTRKRLAAFVRSNAGLKGAKMARRALPLLVEKAASPPEIFLRMVLGLPRRCGGYELVGSDVNQRMTVSKKARAISDRGTLVPDLLWPDHRVAVEYDSDSEHLTSSQVARDAKKRLALAHDGFEVFTVTRQQLRDPHSMRHVAEEIAREIGHPLRIRGQQFPAKHAALYRTGWSLNRYCRDRWLAGDEVGAPPRLG